MKDSEITQYLSRIKLEECPTNLAGLTKLQEQHMEYIPFENLDIVVGRTIALDYQHLFEKVVIKKRGGYCFELNTLHAELLKSLNFSPKPVLGRVWLSNPKKMPPRNHLAHLVELERRTYVTDVGFAGLITSVPLDIHVSAPVNDKDGLVRVVPFADDQFMIQRQTEKGWMNLYSFENVEISAEDIDISNYYMSTHPNSHFCCHKFVGRNTKEGRIGLFNNKMSIRKGIKIVDGRRVDFGKDWMEILNNEFSLHLDFSEEEFGVLFEK
ncbi:MAG: arylamine N-acetyltransferase [Saprospiraceae bacterium]|jgi:arylamine N-acetyltransferase